MLHELRSPNILIVAKDTESLPVQQQKTDLIILFIYNVTL